MEPELLRKIEFALDKAMIDFKENEEIIFDNEKDRLIYKYKSIKQTKNWKSKQTCIVHNCSKKSIEKSHTIQKSGSIKEVSEDSHVLTPRFNTDNGEMEMISMGINEASTFPGYCNEHESLFQEFENLKDIENGEHLGLQLYRTVCREIVINENNLKSTEILIKNYKDFRNKKIKEAFLEQLGPDVLNIPSLDFQELEFTNNDFRINQYKVVTKECKRYLNDFLYKYRDAILSDLKKHKFQKTAYVAISFDKSIPVALAGRGNFGIKLRTKFKNVEVILNVLPMKNKTYIFISTLKKNEQEIKAYISQFQNPLQLISLVESWMIHGTDHWFLKPSVWNNINENFKSEILDSILDFSKNIGNEFDKSIFNDLKLFSINLMEENYSMLNQPLIDLLNTEKNKLTN